MDSIIAASSSSPRKYAAKEAFVTGHDGTNPFEIFILCLAIPIGFRLHSKLITTLLPLRGTSTNYRMEIVIEFATLILPNLILQTSLLSYLVGPIVLLAAMTIISFITPTNVVRSSSTTKSSSSSSSSSSQTQINNKRPPFLTVHRAAVYIQTAIAILAVDFPIFPRRYCKTEVSGYGWMDLGAASFIIIAGWSSAATATNATSLSSSTAASDSISSAVTALKKAVIKCTPLVILGIIRLITIKGVEYQEHVSEYGVHWNFFFTLCCVEGCVVLWKFVKLTTRQQKYWTDASLACQLLINYQLYLIIGGGQDFIENGSRYCGHNKWLCNVYVANREGILGIIGYLGLRLMSESMARYCIWIATTKFDGDESKSSMMATTNLHSLRRRRLFIASVFCWIAHFFLTFVLGIPNSRRSTNVSFITWSLAQNTSQLCLIHFVMTRENSLDTAPRILNCINRFGLPVFFVSNILTGLVNLLVDTMHSSNEKALFVLSIYLGTVCGLALVLDKIKDMRLKRTG
jgi:phosphatidylinositol glycan class W